MARTPSGSLTGTAAKLDLIDEKEYRYELWLKEERQKLLQRENDLIDIAIALPGFEAFWNMVPDFGSRRERIALLEGFIDAHITPTGESHD